MPKPTYTENVSSGLSTDSHSKKWFSKISLKIPKKLKNGKSSSTLSNAINNAKQSYNISPINNSVSNKTIYEPPGENVSISSETLTTQTSQLTLNTTRNENDNTINVGETPIICISPTDAKGIEHQLSLKEYSMETDKHTPSTPTRNVNVNTHHSRLRPSGYGHRRSISDYTNTPAHRPRSYSDTPAPVRPSVLYCDDDDLSDSISYEIPRNLRSAPLQKVKENYYLEKDYDYYEAKTPVVTIHNTPNDTSNMTTPSNTITGQKSAQTPSVATTPVLKHHDYVPSPTTPDHKLISLIEAMQNKTCDNMTAKEFALAVGISICSDDSDCSDDDYEKEDKNSVCTLSSTLSQLTANGKVPTPNEIYNALSVKSLSRQKRKHSAPILNLEMFNPPSAHECPKSNCCSQSLNNEFNPKSCPRAMGDLSHKSSNQKLERRLPPCLSTTKSNESNVTCVASKYSSSSSIHSSQSGTYVPDLPENDDDSYCSSSSYLQQSMNNSSPDIHGKNSLSTTFYSLPRVTFHSNVNNVSPIIASKSTNSIPTSKNYLSNCNPSYRDMGLGASNRPHSRVASSISINSQSSGPKKSPSSPISSTPSLSNANANANASSASNTSSKPLEIRNMYINSKTIATPTSTLHATPFPTNDQPYPISSSWSHGEKDVDHLCCPSHPANSSTPSPTPRTKTRTKKSIEMLKGKPSENNKVEVYTKGRFTITKETYHNRSASTHLFQVELNQ